METIFQQAALIGDVWVLWVLVGCSILAVAVIVERGRILRRVDANNRRDVSTIEKAFDAGSIEKYMHASASKSPGPALLIARDLVRNRARDGRALNDLLRSHLIRERTELDRNIVVLSTLGNNAPFIGLFGTVLGVIKAFHDLAVSGSTGITVVMSGISAALVMTALGIFVAIPAVIANNYFRTRINRILDESESLGLRLIALLGTDGRKKEN